MTIARVIILKTPEQKFSDAERIWKSQCAPLMRRQKGCRLEKFMRSTERPDLYISYSEWDSVADIEKYRAHHRTPNDPERGARVAGFARRGLDLRSSRVTP